MPITKLTPENNYPYLQERLEALEQAVPEAFADGRINWDTLREVLGDNLEDEGRAEFFGLNWPGKREARKKAATPSRATLVPVPGEGVNEDTTENLFIEGDNLEVLKLLQKSYAGKIKMIYIDPPYNTGNDFIYNDNFTDPLEAYLDYTGARGESGELLTTNTRADGRFHSKWLNMMYPRLILACQLLREDGIIFISIDDNEIADLRMMMNEIFGEENFLATVIWHKVYSPRMDTEGFSVFHDYVLVYGKSSFAIPYRLGFSQNEAQFSFVDVETGKKYRRRSIRKEGMHSLRADAPSAFFALDAPDGTKVFPIKPNGVEGNWRWSRKKYEEEKIAGNVEWVKTERGWEVYAKQYLSDDASKPPITIWDYQDVGHTHEASDEIARLLGPRVFDSPKPTRLIQRMLEIGTSANSEDQNIVLDFFAGSSSTAHAVLKQNLSDSGIRNFIMVQIPEKAENGKYQTIADIGKERIRQAIKSLQNELVSEKSKLPLLSIDTPQTDLGFKVVKYTCSNFKQWKPLKEEGTEALTSLFDNLSEPLISGWNKEDLLNEILLLEGFPLTSKITYLEDHLKNDVYRVNAPDFCAHDLFVCLDETIHPATVELLTMGKEDIFVCLDSALSDELKARVQDQFNAHVI